MEPQEAKSSRSCASSIGTTDQRKSMQEGKWPMYDGEFKHFHGHVELQSIVIPFIHIQQVAAANGEVDDVMI